MEALFTIIRNDSGPLSKSFTLVDGKLVKTAAADLVTGVARRVGVRDIRGLAAILADLHANEALTFGIPPMNRARIATQKALHRGARGVICRDREHFRWPEGRGVLMLDIDKPRKGNPLKATEFDAMLAGLLPWWPGSARLYRPSASAFISDAETGEIYT